MMENEFNGWKKSGLLFDPISTDRRESKSFKGASKFPLPEIFTAISKIENISTKQKMVWRGQANIKWPLKSALQRYLEYKNPDQELTNKKFMDEQNKLLKNANKRGIGLTEVGSETNLHVWSQLQHHGVPTHLLDATEDALTALWFACQPCFRPSEGSGRETKEDGVLFAIDVSSFSHLTTSSKNDDYDISAFSKTTGRGTKVAKPLFIRNHVMNKRIYAQRASFITSVHPVPASDSGVKALTTSKSVKLSEVQRNFLEKPTLARNSGQPPRIRFIAILIPQESKRWILSILESGDKRSHNSLFPDVLGMADEYRVPSDQL